MPGMVAAYLNAIANHGGTLIGFASLHSGDPAATGANEISGGSPAYARKAITWFAAAAGNLDNNANPTFDVPAGTTVNHVGFWSAATGGTFYGSATITSETFAAQGTYSLTDADINHNAA